MKSFRSNQTFSVGLFILAGGLAMVLSATTDPTHAQTPRMEKRNTTKWEWNDDGWRRKVEVHGKAEFNQQYSDVSALRVLNAMLKKKQIG